MFVIFPLPTAPPHPPTRHFFTPLQPGFIWKSKAANSGTHDPTPPVPRPNTQNTQATTEGCRFLLLLLIASAVEEKDARQLEHLGTRLPDCRSRPESPAKSVRSPAELLGDPYKSHTFASNSICALACTKRESECHIINGHEPFCIAIEGYCLAQEDHPPQQLHITMQRRGARSSGIRNRHARMACSNLPVRVPGHSAINDGGPRERISACHGFSTLLLTAMSWLPPSVIARLPRP